ncbi:MAG: DPP IV N-terminal domain-containing protein [Pyrinomonadaceae bacterium]|nr:DPP IV N-terminal domain-containing protein [Pyrinomonadaceae bacterium]
MQRSFSRPSFLLLAFLLLHSAAHAQQKLLTIDDIFDPKTRVNFSGSAPTILGWTTDGQFYLQRNNDPQAAPILKVNALTGESASLYDAGRMEAALRALPGLTPEDAKRLAFRSVHDINKAQTRLLINHGNDLYVYDLASATAKRLTTGAEEEQEAEFSPDGRSLAFVRNNNLFVLDIASGRERALTTDGGERILNGRLDWLYQEEIYGRGNFKSFWWSPDSKRITYLRLDEKPVADFTVVDHIPRRQDVETTPYPKAGDANPLVELRMASVDGSTANNTVQVIDTSKYLPNDFLIVRVAWTPDSKSVLYQAQNREQTFLDVNFADAVTGKSTTAWQEKTKAWVEAIDNPRWLGDGSFLWHSDRTGFRHLYRYSADGKLINPVTKGEWEVRSLDAVDERNGFVYFNGTERSPIAGDVYRIKLDGTGQTRLTQTPGSHRANFNPTATHFIDSWNDINTPTQVRLYRADGTLARTIAENRVAALAQYKLGRTEFLQVKTRDGFTMEAMMIKPPDFDPNKKYPVMSYTYSGPQAPSVRNSWGGATYMWHQLLAQKGYIIWICDNRSASGKGVQAAWPVYKNFGELELRDLLEGVAYLKSQPYVDPARIGLWGWSFGGFMTSYALTHSDAFKIGIAGGSVTDWKLYDSIYTERYMSTPQNNPEGYARTAPQAAAANLHGKLLLIHGAMDDNVHMQNTIQFAYELQKAGKPFQLMVYPKSRHGVTDPLLLKHMRGMMTDFIVNNL